MARRSCCCSTPTFTCSHRRKRWFRLSAQSLMILIAGPYRSGTGDDPELMAKNLRTLESVALPLYRAGHIPLIGEWLALPLLREAGSKRPGDAIYDEILYPIANRLLGQCDAVLRLPAPQKGPTKTFVSRRTVACRSSRA